MQHIHAREHLRGGAAVRVDCDHQCNVLVMDDANYARYRRDDDHRYYGGFFRRLPAVVKVPHDGFWNIVLDLGGGLAQLRYNISYQG
jgi:hypothetical protein